MLSPSTFTNIQIFLSEDLCGGPAFGMDAPRPVVIGLQHFKVKPTFSEDYGVVTLIDEKGQKIYIPDSKSKNAFLHEKSPLKFGLYVNCTGLVMSSPLWISIFGK